MIDEANHYTPKVDLGESGVAPDSWCDTNGLIPPPDFVVSRFRDGSVASYYRELTWNLTPYDPNDRRAWLHFSYWGDAPLSEQQSQLLDEMHFLMFLLLWKRPGKPLSGQSLGGYLVTIRQAAAFCERVGCKLSEFLGCRDLVIQYVAEGAPGGRLTALKNLLGILVKLGPKRTGFAVLGAAANKVLLPHLRKYKEASKQYAPIPTRIYSKIISLVAQAFSEWEVVESRFLELVKVCSKNPLLGKLPTQQIRIAKERNLEREAGNYETGFRELLSEYRLTDYFEANGLDMRVQGLSRGLGNILALAKLCVVTYSGMRNKEATYLPYNCLGEDFGQNGKVHYLILGVTTKLGLRQTKWVTNAEGHRAIKIAQRIANVVYDHLGDQPVDTRSKINKYPLFIAPSYLGLGTTAPKMRAHRSLQPLAFRYSQAFVKALGPGKIPEIEEADLIELEHIDPHRAWRTEKAFRLGQPWRLTDHQLRRSLALYAQRSGLVSLPSLRRQLQHITEEMSRYYARNSVFATNFIGGDKKHFGWEWQDAGAESSGLAFIRDVLFTEEPLFGGYANWLGRRLGATDGQVLLDRDATMKRFQKGELAYKETPIGGCTKVGPCDELAIRFLDVDCIGGCANLVGRLSKLERVIKGQAALVNSLQKDSIEWRIESADLDVLMATRTRVLQQRDEV